MRDLLQGNLGFSFLTRRNVRTDIATYLPATVELAGYALLLGFVLAVITGTAAAYRRGKATDATGRLSAIAGLSVPVFWLALLLQLLFSTELGWLPLGGRLSPGMAPPPSRHWRLRARRPWPMSPASIETRRQTARRGHGQPGCSATCAARELWPF